MRLAVLSHHECLKMSWNIDFGGFESPWMPCVVLGNAKWKCQFAMLVSSANFKCQVETQVWTTNVNWNANLKGKFEKPIWNAITKWNAFVASSKCDAWSANMKCHVWMHIWNAKLTCLSEMPIWHVSLKCQFARYPQKQIVKWTKKWRFWIPLRSGDYIQRETIIATPGASRAPRALRAPRRAPPRALQGPSQSAPLPKLQ